MFNPRGAFPRKWKKTLTLKVSQSQLLVIFIAHVIVIFIAHVIHYETVDNVL